MVKKSQQENLEGNYILFWL